jgi:dihydroflavonol-4-reductase
MILVTGGTGFLGAYVIQELVQQGFSVRAIKRPGAQLPFYIEPGILQEVAWMEGDVLDIIALQDAMTNVDCIVHAAAVVSFNDHDKEEMFNVNIEGTANVVNVALELNVPRLIHISSVAALGRSQNGERVNERKEWIDNDRNTAYAVSKHLAEMEVWRGYAEGLETVILNPSTIIGFGDWTKSSSAIFKSIYDGFPYYSNGTNGFVAVEDVAKAVAAFIHSPVSGERYIVNGDNWSFKLLFETIATAMKRKAPSREATPFLGAVAWRIEKMKSIFTGKRPLLTRESAKIAQFTTFFENDKLLKTVEGFSFTPLQQAVTNAAARYLQHQSSAQRF